MVRYVFCLYSINAQMFAIPFARHWLDSYREDVIGRSAHELGSAVQDKLSSLGDDDLNTR